MLDMIISDCPIDSTQQEGLFSVKIGECGWVHQPASGKPFCPVVWKNAACWCREGVHAGA